jgi:hypothetical protein
VTAEVNPALIERRYSYAAAVSFGSSIVGIVILSEAKDLSRGDWYTRWLVVFIAPM